MEQTQGVKNIKYWEIIHWDATSFLTQHDEYNAHVYYDKITPSIIRSVILLFRSIFGGIIYFLQAIILSFIKPDKTEVLGKNKYLLLITNGTAKYASEEREIIEACLRKKLGIIILYPNEVVGVVKVGKSTLLMSVMNSKDYAWALFNWIINLFKGFNNLFSGDKKRRNLFVSSVFSIRKYFINIALVRRIKNIYGKPIAVLSLCPSVGMSTAIIKYMKRADVITAGIRTQSTSRTIEHISINTDVLFCKSFYERKIYNEIYSCNGPRLENACLLSVPEVYPDKPIELPEKYVLVLGTCQEGYNEFLFKLAELKKLPIVFKGHNLGKDIDKAFFESNDMINSLVLCVTDIRHNRQIINNATVVISACSTLLYYAILCNKPIIIVTKNNNKYSLGEFESAPLIKIQLDGQFDKSIGIFASSNELFLEMRSWFEQQYYLEKGADYMVNYLKECSKCNGYL